MKWPIGLASILLCMIAACSQGKAPQALPLDQAPALMEASFKGANPAVARSAHLTVACLQSNDWAGALALAQTLCAEPGLSEAQRQTASRVMLAVQEQIHQEAAKGDATASQILQIQRNQK